MVSGEMFENVGWTEAGVTGTLFAHSSAFGSDILIYPKLCSGELKSVGITSNYFQDDNLRHKRLPVIFLMTFTGHM